MQSISSVGNSGQAIDLNTNVQVTDAVYVDNYFSLWGSSSFSISFSQGGNAGTASQMLLTCGISTTTNCGSLQDTVSSTKTEYMYIVMNTEDAYYELDKGEMLVTSFDHLDSTATGLSASVALTDYTISLGLKFTTASSWMNWYVSSLTDASSPSTAGVLSRTPIYTHFEEDMHKYEICVF